MALLQIFHKPFNEYKYKKYEMFLIVEKGENDTYIPTCTGIIIKDMSLNISFNN